MLKKHNPPGAEDLKGMLANTAKIEKQLSAAISEMAAMRRELAAIREESHPMRSVLQSAIAKMQEQIQALRQQLDALKANIIDGCKNTLKAFKEHGAKALNNIAKFFKVKPALEAIAKSCDMAAKEDTKTINKIERISKEYHKAGRHVKNIGRAIMGKELITKSKPVGIIAKAVEAPFKASRACNLAMRNAAREALKSFARLEKTAERPKPIKEQFKAAAKQAAEHNARNPQTKEKAARDERN